MNTSFYRVQVRALVLKCRRTRLNSEVIYSGKRFDFVRRKKEAGGQTKNIWLAHKKKTLNAPCRKYVETM